MMKNISKLAALAVATAFLLAGFPACSGEDDGDGDPTLEKIEIAIADDVKTTYNIGEAFDKAGITVTATYSNGVTQDVTDKAEFTAKVGDTAFTTEAAGEFNVTLTATYGGKTVSSDPCKITVKSGGGTTPGDGGDDDPKGPGDDATLDSIEIAIAATLKTEYTVGEEFDKTGITVTAKYSDGSTQNVTDKAEFTATSGDATFTTATAGTYEVTLTATYEGKTASVTRTITVKVNGTTYAWNFQAAGLKTILSYSPSTDVATEGKDQLDAEGTYESTPAGLTLVLPKGAAFNKVDTAMSASNASSVGASTGAIEPHATADITVNVRGPFTATMLCGSNSSSAKDDRYAYIKVNGTEVAAPGKVNTSLDVGEALSYTYTGTDEVTVAFGVSANYVRIYDIKIITENGDGAGKTDGEVKSKAEFVPDTNDTTVNDVATLGLEGTSAASSDTNVATATIADGKVVISSVSAGKAEITVTDGTEGHEATIEVTVKPNGTIALGKISKYFDTNAVVEKASWTVTPGSDAPIIAGDGGLKVTFDGSYDSSFKFGSNNQKLIITTPKLAAGKNITIKVTGKTGSNGNAIDFSLTEAKNAAAAKGNIEGNKVTFPSDSKTLGTGTFIYTVTEQGIVELTFQRTTSKSAKVTELEITVGDAPTEE